jgi:hypothetical protein
VAKKRTKTMTKRRISLDPRAVAPPCLQVRIGSGTQAAATTCRVATSTTTGAVKRFDVVPMVIDRDGRPREIKTTSASVSVQKDPKNKRWRGNLPCKGSLRRAGCPIQLAFEDGQPFMRLCQQDNKPGPRIDFKTLPELRQKSREICAAWQKLGKFKVPKGTPLRGSDD